MTYYICGNHALLLSLSLSLALALASVFFVAPLAAQAALYLPGATLDPACAPTDPNCGISTIVASSTANSIPYYAANGSALSATSTFQILSNGTASTTNLIVVNSLTVGTLSGFLKATAGAIATSLINLASDVTGILPVANGGTGVAAIASGFIPFGNGTGAISTSTALFFDSTNSRLGIGTSSPYAALSVAGQVVGSYFTATTTTATSTFAGGLTVGTSKFVVDATSGNVSINEAPGLSTWQFHVVGPNSGQNAITIDAYGAENVFLARAFGGTKSAPTALKNGDFMMNFASRGYDGVAVDGNGNPSAYNPSAVDMKYYAAGDWTGTSHPAMIRWSTTPANGLAATDVMWLTESGQLLVGALGGFVNTPPVSGPCALCVTGEIALSASDLPMLRWWRNGTVKGYDAIGNGTSISGAAAAGDRIIRAEQKLVVRAGGDTGGFVVDTSGQVGIGTTGPSKTLEVAGAASNNVDANSQTSITSTAVYNASPVGGLSFGVKYNSGGSIVYGTTIQGYKENATDGNFSQALRFTTQANGVSPATRMTINSSGNVGIGTTSPIAKFSIQNSTSDTARQPLFVIASSTATFATTTLFSVANTGDVTINGSSGSTCTIGNGVTGTSCSSDERLKTNIALIVDPLQSIEQIRGVTFNWADPTKNQSQFIGVIAQDVQKVFPQAVSSTADGFFTVDYGALVAPLIEAVKELAKKVDLLAATVAGFAQSFTTTVVHTNEVCVKKSDGSEVCINGDQVSKILDQSGQSPITITDVSPPTTYTITVTQGENGTISPDTKTSIASGDTVSFTITPNTDYGIETLVIDGQATTTSTTYDFTNVTGNHTITSTFASTTLN